MSDYESEDLNVRAVPRVLKNQTFVYLEVFIFKSSNMVWKNEKENLERLINENISYEEIGRIYGCTGSNIKKVAIRLGIEIKQRRSINQSETFNKGTAKKGICANCGKEYILYQGHRGNCCCHECASEHQYKENIRKWKEGKDDGYCGKEGSNISCFVRKYIFQKNDGKCECCGKEYVNPYTKLSILQIHHKDGDATNNKEENLQLLCPNCHAMTENFGSRNKNSTRTYRKKYYKN